MGGAKPIIFNDNVTLWERIQMFLGEFFGTFILVFLGCQGCVKLGSAGPPHEQISWSFGLAIMVAIQCFAHISGGHINPVVTLAAVIMGNLAIINVPIYIFAQFLGAIGGYASVMALTPSGILTATVPGTCSPGLGPNVTPVQGLFNEFLLTLILIWLVCSIWDWQNLNKHDSVTIRLGLCVAVLAMSGGGYSGSNMNPARSFAPALLNWNWDHHWVWWLGPLLAGAVGATFWRFVFVKPQPKLSNIIPEGIPLNKT